MTLQADGKAKAGLEEGCLMLRALAAGLMEARSAQMPARGRFHRNGTGSRPIADLKAEVQCLRGKPAESA